MIEIKIPANIEQAIVLKWFKNHLDFVTNGEEVVEIESDKASIVIPATESGVLHQLKKEKDMITPQDIIGHIETA